MRNISRAVALLLIGHPLLSYAQSPAAHRPTADQNSILNMYDAFGYQKRGTILDWSFSALIHYNGKTILFDTGNNADKFEHNVKALGVDLNQVDIAVLSHRHYDHISGFDYMLCDLTCLVAKQVLSQLSYTPTLQLLHSKTFSESFHPDHKLMRILAA